jgi:3-isopropylmalate dehydrogenase
MKNLFKIAILKGDGIGHEIIDQAVLVLKTIETFSDVCFELNEADVGGTAYEKSGHPLPEATIKVCADSQAILFGAVGNPIYDNLPRALRPEQAILGLRQHFGLFANFRPAKLYAELAHASTLKPEIVSDLDILIVRELNGDVYFGQPRGIRQAPDGLFAGSREGFDTMRYSEPEVERIAHLAFQAAQKRNQKLCSVDKANVLETSQLWRDTVINVAKSYPDVKLEHMYVDNAAMQLIKNPKAFDVIVTGNLFGDILSDASAMLTGSIGMLASASFNEKNFGLYEPSHGSAPDIAGQNKANPLATILSAAMMLRFSFNRSDLANMIESAIQNTLTKGYRTADIDDQLQIGSHSLDNSHKKRVGTQEMGQAVCDELLALAGVSID